MYKYKNKVRETETELIRLIAARGDTCLKHISNGFLSMRLQCVRSTPTPTHTRYTSCYSNPRELQWTIGMPYIWVAFQEIFSNSLQRSLMHPIQKQKQNLFPSLYSLDSLLSHHRSVAKIYTQNISIVHLVFEMQNCFCCLSFRMGWHSADCINENRKRNGTFGSKMNLKKKGRDSAIVKSCSSSCMLCVLCKCFNGMWNQ